eukprot:1134390-Pelagomonas_calceolata.AAC.4
MTMPAEKAAQSKGYLTCKLAGISLNVACEIAVLQKRGLGKDAYVLKEEYAVGDQEGGGDEQQD